VAQLERAASVAEINTAFAMAACGPLADVLGYTNLPLVSSDFRGDSRSSVVDGLMTALLYEQGMVRVVGWYDNEWGYASRVADLACFIGECERSEHSMRQPERVQVFGSEQVEPTLRPASF
jgi:glyceraldehyde 3-phosphate dehydrogenase